MLSLFFKQKLSIEQDLRLFEKFKNFPQKYESDVEIGEFYSNGTIYFDDARLAQEKVIEMQQEGFEFLYIIDEPTPILHDDFICLDKEIQDERNYSKCSVQVKIPETPPQNYATTEQFEQFTKKTIEQFSILAKTMERAISVPTTPSTPARAAPASVPSTSMSAEFTAKNELIANGITCKRCSKNIRNISPITQLVMAVRDHVMEHFDKENPHLKRFSCRQCTDFKTNFVDDFENHLNRHGSMTSLPEKRQKLTVSLLTETLLKIICKLCNACFPDVFEKSPPAINTILAVTTPQNAKLSVFPNLDRLYCSRYNIPYRRHSLPPSTIRID